MTVPKPRPNAVIFSGQMPPQTIAIEIRLKITVHCPFLRVASRNGILKAFGMLSFEPTLNPPMFTHWSSSPVGLPINSGQHYVNTFRFSSFSFHHFTTIYRPPSKRAQVLKAQLLPSSLLLLPLTRKRVQGLVGLSSWGFESPLRHQAIVFLRALRVETFHPVLQPDNVLCRRGRTGEENRS